MLVHKFEETIYLSWYQEQGFKHNLIVNLQLYDLWGIVLSYLYLTSNIKFSSLNVHN